MRTPILKTAFVAALFLAFQFTASCTGKSQQAETHDHAKPDSTAVAYICPMHPDVTGKEGDTCSKCGMKLELAQAADSTANSHE